MTFGDDNLLDFRTVFTLPTCVFYFIGWTRLRLARGVNGCRAVTRALSGSLKTLITFLMILKMIIWLEFYDGGGEMIF